MLQNAPMHAYLPAQNVARARKFYEETLGFKPGDEIPEGGVVYHFGDGTSCFLYPTPNAGTSRASQAFWQVQDIDAEVTELKKRGVKFESYDMPGMQKENSIYSAGKVRTAWFKDSEGNILAIVQETTQ